MKTGHFHFAGLLTCFIAFAGAGVARGREFLTIIKAITGPPAASGDGVVKYPLTFTKLIIELPEKVLYLNKMITVPRPEIYIKGLQVTYEEPEKAFASP